VLTGREVAADEACRIGLSLLEQDGLAEDEALANELRHGLVSLGADALDGARRFAEGAGRHGT
jgi:enoyl-CoA hydratase